MYHPHAPPAPPMAADIFEFIFIITIAVLGFYTVVNNCLPRFTYCQKMLLPENHQESITYYIEQTEPLTKVVPFPTILSKPKCSLSVVTVLRNASKSAEQLIEKLFQYFNSREEGDKTYTFELIIVDNCSTDGTAEIVSNLSALHNNIFLLRTEKLLPIGRAMMAGALHTRGKRIFIFHPFLALKITDFEVMSEKLNELTMANKCAIVAGVWPIPDNLIPDFSTKLGKFITYTSSWLFSKLGVKGTAISRSHCFLMTREASVFILPNVLTSGISVEIELLTNAGMTGCNIGSVENELVVPSNVRMTSIDRLYELIMLFYIYFVLKTGIHKLRRFTPTS